jgi:hypothetical protein
MPTIDHCLYQIRRVLEVADGHEAAYVARSRIGRLINSCLHITAKAAGVRAPDFPCRFQAPPYSSQQLVDLTTLCNQIYDLSRTLAQPSEPLEARWTAGWQDLRASLMAMEHALLELKATS